MHLEYICLNITTKVLNGAFHISKDIAIQCSDVPKLLVKNRNLNEWVSGHTKWHAPALYMRGLTGESAKRMVEYWWRYSSSKICINESKEKSRAAESRGNDNN